MSASIWDWTLASADGLLTTEECSLLLETDLLDTDDILKTFPHAATKIESGDFHLQDDVSSLYPPSPPEAKPSRAELASDLLQQLESQCKQENIFSNWLEEKVDLPIFENISHAAEAVEPPPVYAVPAPAPQPTEELLREFETVYGAVELTHLTPPQSPPGPATQLLLSYAQHAQAAPPAVWPAPAPAPAYDPELQAVEELVRHRAAQLASPQPSLGSSSPRSSPPSSPRSSTDEDWTQPAGARRPKPYARGDDRRSRKKEQNKNAATRYRQKKKAEIEVLLGEEQQLRARHGELGSRCADLQREIRYLKSLMRDLFKAKGLIK